MIEDLELFELCKSVYEKLGWKGEFVSWIQNGKTVSTIHKNHPEYYGIVETDYVCPLYTSDYLLEKLYFVLFKGKRKHISLIFEEDGSYSIDADDIYNGPRLNVQNADTTLKALLKLTIKLADEGMITKGGSDE